MGSLSSPSLDAGALAERWRAAWPEALAVWSRFTRLRPPMLCLTASDAKAEGLTESFAMIRLSDQAVVVNLDDVRKNALEDHAVEVLAHEIGHHVLAPANLTNHAKCIARMRHALPTVEHCAPLVANLFTDLLINDRLKRAAELKMERIYQKLVPKKPSRLWKVYLRIYELLWGLERGALGAPFRDDRMEGDALLGMRVVRSYATDFVRGAGGFAALLLPYVMEEAKATEGFQQFGDTMNAGAGGIPDGLAEMDADETTTVHPALDPFLGDDDVVLEGELMPNEVAAHAPSGGQTRTPFAYGEILRAAGVVLPDDQIAARYYRERALPHLVPFPSRKGAESTDPLPEGLEPWDIGMPLDQADWLESVLQSPRVVPGMTTVQRLWGTAEGREPERVPLDLDLYVDSSGSMPHPYNQVSYLTLAGAIMALSALRAGARVQAVLWSAKNQVLKTPGFVRDELSILQVLAGYFGGGTQFPIPLLRTTYQNRKPSDRPAHIMVISDDGISTMFDADEQGNSGWDIARMALDKCAGGGTFVLNLPERWEAIAKGSPVYASIARSRDELGFAVHRVSNWDDLVRFAHEFSRTHYGSGE
ncbi:MAG: VWA domain-containing protein [Polyangiaceae bacterium]|nr:VWA domain-containing protein [Polyangiaceae bacterium]